MSDIPETPTNAARVLIGWFAGGLAFQSVETLHTSYATSASYGLGAIVVAIVDYKLKDILAGSPRLTRSLNSVASDARWWVGIALASLVIIAVSPLVEERRWPFSAWFAGSAGSFPTADEIASATVKALQRPAGANQSPPLPARSPQELRELVSETDAMSKAIKVPLDFDTIRTLSQNPQRICLDLDSKDLQEKLLQLSSRFKEANSALLSVIDNNRIDGNTLFPLITIVSDRQYTFGIAASFLDSYVSDLKSLGEHPSCDDMFGLVNPWPW